MMSLFAVGIQIEPHPFSRSFTISEEDSESEQLFEQEENDSIESSEEIYKVTTTKPSARAKSHGKKEIVILVAVILIFMGLVYRDQLKLKWNLLRLSRAAKAFRNETLKWHKILEDTDSRTYEETNLTNNQRLIESNKDLFWEIVASQVPKNDLNVVDKEKAWNTYLRPYYAAADAKLSTDSYSDFTRVKDYIVKEIGYNSDVKMVDYDMRYDATFSFDVNAFKTKMQDLKNKGDTANFSKMEFFLNHYRKFHALQEHYVATRKEVLDYVKDRHPAIGRMPYT